MDLEAQVQLIRNAGRFHPEWYRAAYRDVALLGMDPAAHYVKYGAPLGREPGRDFDTRYYLARCPDAAESGLSPLAHYLLHGAAQGCAPHPDGSARHPVTLLRDGAEFDADELRARHAANPLAEHEDDFALCRIIGNDLVPRHAPGQSRANLRFVLENEPPLAGCERLWVINRIIDPEEKSAIVALLEAHEQPYIDIPFEPDAYRRLGWDFGALPRPDYLDSPRLRALAPAARFRLRLALYRHKILYAMNNNGARNTALRAGRKRAKWVLPWDGNCFVTARAWEEITAAVGACPYLPHFAVPMQRMSDNALLRRDSFVPDPREEPQLIFRADSPETFAEAVPYGRRPKVELLWRLGMRGPWDDWTDDPWDQPRRALAPDAGAYGVAGWVARMFSGVGALERQNDTESYRARGRLREEAIAAAIDRLDARLLPPDTPGPFPGETATLRTGRET